MTETFVDQRYRVLELVGTRVCRVQDTLHPDRPTILKSVDSPHEILLRATLNHPGLPEVFDFGGTYFTQAAIDAPTLAAQAPIDDLRRLLEITADAADVLAYLHERDVMHGDIKPSNVLACTETTPKLRRAWLIDLGSVGTPGYLAPEVDDGEALTAASDMFALGATLLACASGRLRETDEIQRHVRPLISDDPHRRPTAAAVRHRLADVRRPELPGPSLVGAIDVLQQIASAERAVIVGPSGAGKTTILRAARLQRQVAGQNATDLPCAHADVVFVDGNGSRDGDIVTSTHPIEGFLTVRLSALSERMTERMVRSMVGAELPAPVIAGIYEASQGVPAKIVDAVGSLPLELSESGWTMRLSNSS